MAVTLFPGGVSNGVIGGIGATFPDADPTRVCSFFDDFLSLDVAAGTTVAQWRANGTTPVIPTQAPAQYGRALFSPTAAVTDKAYMQLASQQTIAAGSLIPNFFFTINRDVWFQTLFQVSNANLSVINAGLFPSIAVDGAPESAADGVFFTKPSGSTTISLKTIKTAVGNTVLPVATLADATDIKLGFHWNSIAQAIFVFVNDVPAGSISGATSILNIPAVGLLPLIGHQSNTANRTSSWDFVHAAQSRMNEGAA